jgi:pseudouridine-5'-phosphate glycosidase
VDRRYDSIAELAAAVRLHLSLGLGTGVLIANPIPIADEMASDLYDRALQTALSEAETHRVRGRAVTPFLLDRMHAVTGGDSVRANVALLRHNAQVAAGVAVAGV